MHMITYISEANIAPELLGLEINDILTSAKQRNKSLGISGVLFLRGTTFFQTIEGPEDAVRSVFQSILADERHNDLYVLIDEAIDEREYLDIIHEIGVHFWKGGGFCPSDIYTYCWRIVASLAPNRLECEV